MASVLLADPARHIVAARVSGGISVRVPEDLSDTLCPVIRMKVKGAPEVTMADRIHQTDDGTVVLGAGDALIENQMRTRAEFDAELDAITGWDEGIITIGWNFELSAPGKFQVRFTYLAEEENRLSIQGGREDVVIMLPAAAGSGAFATRVEGPVEFEQEGPPRLTLKPSEGRWSGMRIRSIELVPFEE